MGLSGASGVIDRDQIHYGEWPRVYGITDPLTAPAEVPIGAVKGGALRLSRTDIQFFDTNTPKRLEMTIPTEVGMSFAGNAFELSPGLLHFLVGDGRIDDETRYIYPGATCELEDVDLLMRGERVNCAGVTVVWQMHRARASGALEFTGGDDFIGVGIEISAQDDSSGSFAGGNATNPLGFLWLSAPT